MNQKDPHQKINTSNHLSTREILDQFKKNHLNIQEAENLIKKSSLLDVDDFLKFDTHRESRSGIPEVVFSESKTNSMLIKIIENIVPTKSVVLFTRLKENQIVEIEKFSEQTKKYKFEFFKEAKIIVVSTLEYSFPPLNLGPVVIITAGSSDIPVAKEAEITLKLMGVETLIKYDIGIAGLHRLIDPLYEFLKLKPVSIIVCAGMEGALPSVVAGLVDIPVIGVPVSVGYGYGGKGLGALTSMLQSCSPGLSVVNIDGGFNAGAMAALIAKRVSIK